MGQRRHRPERTARVLIMNNVTMRHYLRQGVRHAGHTTHVRNVVGNFCGRRLVTEFTRCADCGGELVYMQQYTVRRGQRR